MGKAAAIVSLALVAWLSWQGTTAVAPASTGARPPEGGALRTAATEVDLAGTDVSGWREGQLRALIKGWAGQIHQPPLDAYQDRATRGLIPHLNGLDVDEAASLERALAAPPGSHVDLVYREIPPKHTLDQMPDGAIYRGNEAKHAVTFLVNVAWGEQYLAAMLETFRKKGVGATFFLVGEWAGRLPEQAAAIAADGHEIASHGHTAAAFATLGPEQVAQEIRRAETAIMAATGQKPAFFSPHRGEISPQLLQTARTLGYPTVLWSLDTVDWSNPGVDWMLQRILSRAHNGALILMHPTAQTAEALEPMIDGLQRKGFRIVTLKTLLSPSPLARDGDPHQARTGNASRTAPGTAR